MCRETKLEWKERPTAIKNHFVLEISLGGMQETSLCPKNLPPRRHNFHRSAKKSCKELSAQTACAGAD